MVKVSEANSDLDQTLAPEHKLDGCGCYTHPDGFWPCCLHRGQTEEMKAKDNEQMVWEGAAMNGWTR